MYANWNPFEISKFDFCFCFVLRFCVCLLLLLLLFSFFFSFILYELQQCKKRNDSFESECSLMKNLRDQAGPRTKQTPFYTFTYRLSRGASRSKLKSQKKGTFDCLQGTSISMPRNYDNFTAKKNKYSHLEHSFVTFMEHMDAFWTPSINT